MMTATMQGDHEGDHDHGDKTFGIIESLHVSDTGSLTGTWIISGMSYTVTDSTELDDEYGGFDEGVCVTVEVSESDPTVATEIESELQYK